MKTFEVDYTEAERWVLAITTVRKRWVFRNIVRKWWESSNWCLFSFRLTIGYWSLDTGVRFFGRGFDWSVGWGREYVEWDSTGEEKS